MYMFLRQRDYINIITYYIREHSAESVQRKDEYNRLDISGNKSRVSVSTDLLHLELRIG